VDREVSADRQLIATGTALCAEAIAGLDDDALAGPSLLPGWTRKHVMAHLAANAEALGRLLHWAKTGERTPMYASTEQRNADIEAGATRPGTALAQWFHASAQALDDALDTMTEAAWSAEVLNAQGRAVRATEVPWMRSREVLIHAVDLGTGITFAQLPPPVLEALTAEISSRRAGAGEHVSDLRGSLPDLAAYLAGRGTAGVTTADGSPAPAPPAWL